MGCGVCGGIGDVRASNIFRKMRILYQPHAHMRTRLITVHTTPTMCVKGNLTGASMGGRLKTRINLRRQWR